MEQKQKWPSVVSRVSQSHLPSAPCGFVGEKVDRGSPFIFRFERKAKLREHRGGKWRTGGGGGSNER